MGIKGRIVACTHWVKKEPGSDFLDLSYAATPLKRWAATTISGHLPAPEPNAIGLLPGLHGFGV